MLEADNRRLQAQLEEARRANHGAPHTQPPAHAARSVTGTAGRTVAMVALLTFAFVLLPPLGGLVGSGAGLVSSGNSGHAGGGPVGWHSRTLKASQHLLGYEQRAAVVAEAPKSGKPEHVFPLGQPVPGVLPPRQLAITARR